MSRESLSNQGVEPNAEAWTRYADDIGRNAPNEKAPISQTSHLKWAQRSVPQSGRINLEKASRLEATHLILKSSSEIFQKQFVENRLEKYERQITVERGEIKPSVILPTVEKSAIPAIEIEPTSKKPAVLDAKPVIKAAADRSEEIKQRAVLPVVEKSPTSQIKIEPTQETSVVTDVKPEGVKAERNEIKLEPARAETIVPDVKPVAAKIEREVITIQSTRRKTAVLDAKPVTGEIKLPAVLPVVERSAAPAIEIESARENAAAAGEKPSDRREVLTKEVLKMSRDILDEQGVEPNPQAWKRFENVVTDNLPAQKAGKAHERALEKLQKDTPPSERISFAGKSMLEAMHVILKLTPESESGEIVKDTLAKYEKNIAAERGDVVKPEIKETAKEASFEKAALRDVKPTPKVRNFETIEREDFNRN